jgi:hypothetical protein
MSLPRALSFAFVFLAIGFACKGEVGLNLTVPGDIQSKAAWYEIGAFENGHCDAVRSMLANGVPEGATARLAFKKDETPTFGSIPNGKYAVAAVARDENCTVLATGCNDEDLGSAGKVVIELQAVVGGDATGKCPAGAECQAAKCVPANDNSDPSVGSGCSLELIGAGPLAKPAGQGGGEVSAPAIAPTPGGFIIVYREVDPSGSGARLTILPIDSSGGALLPQRPPLPNPCSNADQTDGVGLVVTKDGTSLMSLSKPPCGQKPELQLLNFSVSQDNSIAVGKFFVSAAPTDDKVALGAVHSSAFVNGQNLVVYSQSGVGHIAHMDPGKGIIGPNGTFGATTGVYDTWMAGNDHIMALLAATSASGSAPSSGLLPDGGPAPAASTDDSSGTMNLLLIPSNTAVDSISAEQNAPRQPVTFPGQWASIAAVAGRVIVMTDGSGPGRSVSYRAFDQNNDDPTDTGGFSTEGSGTVTAGDVTIVGDRAYFAALENAGVALHVFANATTRLTSLRDVTFGLEPRISAINTVRDGRVAVAATDSRVAVVWTTAKTLGPNDATGGYAVFACTQ